MVRAHGGRSPRVEVGSRQGLQDSQDRRGASFRMPSLWSPQTLLLRGPLPLEALVFVHLSSMAFAAVLSSHPHFVVLEVPPCVPAPGTRAEADAVLVACARPLSWRLWAWPGGLTFLELGLVLLGMLDGRQACGVWPLGPGLCDVPRVKGGRGGMGASEAWGSRASQPALRGPSEHSADASWGRWALADGASARPRGSRWSPAFSPQALAAGAARGPPGAVSVLLPSPSGRNRLGLPTPDRDPGTPRAGRLRLEMPGLSPASL